MGQRPICAWRQLCGWVISVFVDETLSERLNLAVSTSLVREIDDWRRAQPEIPTRAEAARALIRLGIDAARKGATTARARPPKPSM